MNVGGKPYRSIWLNADGARVEVIDQTLLPHRFATVQLHDYSGAANAIKTMIVRGAPLIGATAAYGMALAMSADAGDKMLEEAHECLLLTRPTAVNLRWALDEMLMTLKPLPPTQRAQAAYVRAAEICDDDVQLNRAIGEHGLEIIRELLRKKKQQDRINIMTHCNAGWLATVDWGTALAPIYMAHGADLPVHVWVSETRPRNQGASLTAWELAQHDVSHTVIVDNAAGHLLRKGDVDLVIVGSDRTAANGDVCNKIGTYLKALAAKDNGIPFYVALPSPTIDWTLNDGANIPIEERSGDEVSQIVGRNKHHGISSVTLTPQPSPVANPAFDVTPARLVTGLITERGVCAASSKGLRSLFSGSVNERTAAA
ncbi:MAG: S-methyl-5-thioribose-1-phosphate isomerase [Burkholderiales bacterium]